MIEHSTKAQERMPFASRWHRFQRRYAPYIFVSPFFLLFLGFGLFPTLFSMYLSFQKWNPVQGLSRCPALRHYLLK